VRYRTITTVAALLLLGLGLVGCEAGGSVVEPTATPTSIPTSIPTVRTTVPVVPTTPAEPSPPTATPTPSVDPELEALRAGNAFLEFAEADRARTATWARLGYDSFAPHRGDDVLFEWTNKEALWNSIAPGFRDECLLAGPQAVRPMWDAAALIPAGIEPRWTDESTGGRGQFVEFVCAYVDEAAGEPTERWRAVLIATDEGLVGEVVATMPAFTLPESDFETYRDALDGGRREAWAWIRTQPSTEASDND
jgi:hypothetical protein